MRFLGCAACMLATTPAVPSPRAAGRRCPTGRMRGRGRWGAIVAAAVRTRRFVSLAGEARTRRSSPAASEAEKRPSSAAAAAPSPRRHGEKGQACAFSDVQLAILRRRPPSFAPRQRGEGGAAAPDEGPWEVGCDRHAAVRARRFIGGCRRSRKAPLIRPAAAPSPRRDGEKGKQAFSPECSCAFLRQRQPPFSPLRRESCRLSCRRRPLPTPTCRNVHHAPTSPAARDRASRDLS